MIYRAGKKVYIKGCNWYWFIIMIAMVIIVCSYKIHNSKTSLGVNSKSYTEYDEYKVSKHENDVKDIDGLKINTDNNEIVAYIDNSEQPIVEDYTDYKNILGIKDNESRIRSNIKEYENKYLNGIEHSDFEDIEYTINYMHSLNGEELVEYKCNKEYGVEFNGGITGVIIGYNGCLSDMPGKIEVRADTIREDCNEFKEIAHILLDGILDKDKINYLLHSKHTEVKHNKNTSYNILDSTEDINSTEGLIVKAYREIRSAGKDGDKDKVKLPSGRIWIQADKDNCASYVDKAGYVSIFNILKGNKSQIRLDKLTNKISMDKSIIQIGKMMEGLKFNELAEIKPGNTSYKKEVKGKDCIETLSLQIDAFEYDGYDYSDIFYLDIACKNGKLDSGSIKYKYFISNTIEEISDNEIKQANENYEKLIDKLFGKEDREYEFIGEKCILDNNIEVHNGEYYKYGLITIDIGKL